MTIASLPMYDADHAAVERLWSAVAPLMRRHGLADVPDAPLWPADLDAHWLDPQLLLSQTCGYPLVTTLAGRVQLVGAFRYDVDGCSGTHYSSQLVVRADEPGQSLADFRGRTAAFNSTQSQSGHNSLRALVAPLATEGRFFGHAIESGAHRRSIDLIQRGEADIAAIDSVSLVALRRQGMADGLRVIGRTASAPGTPLITSILTSAADLAALRASLSELCSDPILAELRAPLTLAGFEAVPLESYDAIIAMENQALSLGCARL